MSRANATAAVSPTRTLDAPAGLEAFRPEWNAAALERGNLYLTYEWMRSLWESHFGAEGVEFLLHGNDPWSALLPLGFEETRSRGFRLRTALPVTNRYGRNHNDLLLRHSLEAELRWVLTIARERRADLFALASLPDDSPTVPVIRSVASGQGFRVLTEPGAKSPYLTLEGDWDGYLKQQSSNFRSDLKRKGNKARRSALEIRRFTDVASVSMVLEAIYAIETKSWKESTQTSITTNPLAQVFYDRFLHRAAEAGWFESFLLYFEGTPAAYDMGVRFADRYYMLKTSYDQAWSEQSPGVVLREHVVRHLYETGCREHDFLGDDEGWKMRWTSTVRGHTHYYLYDTSRPKANLYSLLRKLQARFSSP
ncbi:MAG TPA: GNAT family N-acetyltransferase [Candidatus Eisenbacteria bacterium]|nr:GNAT family N-acetyltransferase [Candidatus Eisenbacteria bacterium]